MVRGLLASLVLRKNTVVSRGALVSALWRKPPYSAEVNLRQYVHDLRRQLASVDKDVADRLVTVRTEGGSGGYELRVERSEADLDEFTALWSDGRLFVEAGDFLLGAKWLLLALDMWRGQPGCDTPSGGWLEQSLASLEEQRLAAEEDLAVARIALGEGAAVVETLSAVAAEHPGRERTIRLLMFAYYRSGNVHAALELYLRARALMVDELGVDTGSQLNRLHIAMLGREDDLLCDNAWLVKSELPQQGRVVARQSAVCAGRGL
jgi:DNA-binding SARP family transcriptional activator